MNASPPGKVRVGTAYLFMAQIVFLLSGYAMHITLGRSLTPAEYGLFGVTLYAANIIRNFVASGLPMAVTRYVSAKPEEATAVLRAGMRVQIYLTLAVSLLFFVLANPLASLLGDADLAVLFRLTAPITFFFGIFFLIIQYYNGLRSYRLQTALLTGSYLLRAGLAIFLVVLGMQVLGAVLGLLSASAVACFLSLVTLKSKPCNSVFPQSELLKFAAPLILASMAQALLTDMDLMFVKRLVPGEASAGYYTSAKALAQMTPFAFYALSSALYPAISTAHATGNNTLLKKYIEQSNRLLLLIVVPLAVIAFWDAEKILALIYGSTYQAGAPALRWLMISFGLLSILIIHKTIITGCGFPRLSSILTMALLPLYVILQFILIHLLGLGGAALASLLTFLTGVIVSIWIIYAKFHAGFDLPSALRILAAGMALIIADILLAALGMPLLIKIAILAVCYALVIWISGELRPRDLQAFRDDLFRRDSTIPPS